MGTFNLSSINMWGSSHGLTGGWLVAAKDRMDENKISNNAISKKRTLTNKVADTTHVVIIDMSWTKGWALKPASHLNYALK